MTTTAVPRHPLSAVLITLNAAQQLDACLDSLHFADEIIVVDSGSNDGTQAIAQRYGARVLNRAFDGYGPQKQFAVAQAANEWVLCIDADERVSADLRSSIEAALADPSYSAYTFARCNRFLGRWLRHGEGYPDLSLRLFDRRHARWSDDRVHEKVICESAAGRLSGDLLHESAETLQSYLDKQNRYTTWQAEAMHRAGIQPSTAKLFISPLARFIKFYILRLGFLDGVPGLVHIAIGCFNTFAKNAKLKELYIAGKH